MGPKQEPESVLGAAGVDANCTTWPVDLNLKQFSASAADLSRSHSPDVVMQKEDTQLNKCYE